MILPLRKGTDAAAVVAAVRREAGERILVVAGLDADDPQLGALQASGVPFVVHEPPHKAHAPFALCKLWSAMALKAFSLNADVAAVLLLGGDAVGLTADVVDEVLHMVASGCVCVAVRENLHPGWPCFPAVARAHLAVVRDFLPAEFMNQEADVFLSELWRHCGSFAMTAATHLTNTHGGVAGGLCSNESVLHHRLLLEYGAAIRAKPHVRGFDIDICILAGARLEPVPSAIVEHPWRPTMLSMYSGFMFWAPPNLPEALLLTPLAPLLLPAGLPLNAVHAAAACAAFAAALIAADFATMLLWYFVVLPFRVPDTLPAPLSTGAPAARRAAVVLSATFAHNASELGHLAGHLARGRWRNVLCRFNFFLGMHPPALINEHERCGLFCVLAAAALALACAALPSWVAS
ncbi:hypothetical protein FOA52_001789 [Chlamydomonas sp. UWO 241]|nr:hypothetical protein FOA52_001789 [Chlamydomonas sp. UWO 241]